MSVDLNQLSQGRDEVFVLTLDDASRFESQEIVRCISNKRLVCRGTWNHQSVYAKLFIGEQAKRYAERDLRGMQTLTNAHIATPTLLYAGSITGNSGEALIFATVEDGVNAEQVLDYLQNQDQRLQLANKLVIEVARHHQAGLIQHDLYLKNFLLQDDSIYTLDGDGIRPLPRFFPRQAALKNLAVLLSKFNVLDIEGWMPVLVDVYAKMRGWLASPDLHCMAKLVSAHRYKVAHGYADEKVFRQCSDVQIDQASGYFLAISRSFYTEKFRQVLNSPDTLLQPELSKRLKSGNTCTVSLVELDGLKIVVKRYNIKNFWHGLSRALRPSRAADSWANAHRLIIHRVATATPIALLEKRIGFIRRQAYFLAEYIDAPDAAEFFADANADAAQKNKVAEHIARLFHKLYLLKIAHGDFKAGNMKILAGKPLLMDLDSMREYRCDWLFAKRHVRDLRRFMRNWQHDTNVSNMLVAAFLVTYKDTRLLNEAGMAITQNGTT